MQDAMYSVSQAVQLLAVQSHVLRYWEEEMKLPIKRNEMGHRYYTRWDIQVFLSIKELKKKGYSLKEIGKLTPLFYQKQTKQDKPLGGKDEAKQSGTVSPEFMDIISRLVAERMQEINSEEARYKRLDERIRNCQQSRKEAAAATEKKTPRKKRFLKGHGR